jgi:nucleoside-diphosphate-sugar epimerase
MKRIVVMGAAGAIGLALIRQAVLAGTEVLAIHRESERLKYIPQHDLVQILKCDISQLNSLQPEGSYDAFFHLGWKSVSVNSRDDVFAQEENIRYTLDAVDLAHRLGCSIFVGAGSQAEYGRVEGLVSPGSRICPENGYGIAKYAAGRLSQIRSRQLEMRHAWARILSVYGPGDNAYTLIMYCIKSLLKGEKPILTPCEQMWDYIYCDDAARALLLIAEKGKDGGIYCVGSGREQPLREYIEAIKQQINIAAPIGYGERPYNKDQVMRLCADITNLSEDTGFKPLIPFEQGIRETIDWCKKEWSL